MATINLLPWREERREELKKEFLVILGGFAAIGILAVLGWKFVIDGQIEEQQGRNRFLQQRISELDAQVKEIQDLKSKKEALIARMKVIQSLQGNRPQIVHIFDELVRTLPDGVYYTFIDRKNNKLTIRGIAESNNRVSSLMRLFDNSQWFSNPDLKKVNRKGGSSTFDLTVLIVAPANLENQENE